MYSFILARGMFLADPNSNSIESITVDRVLDKVFTEEQVAKELVDSSSDTVEYSQFNVKTGILYYEKR